MCRIRRQRKRKINTKKGQARGRRNRQQGMTITRFQQVYNKWSISQLRAYATGGRYRRDNIWVLRIAHHKHRQFHKISRYTIWPTLHHPQKVQTTTSEGTRRVLLLTKKTPYRNTNANAFNNSTQIFINQ